MTLNTLAANLGSEVGASKNQNVPSTGDSHLT
jgi:hypothetical protein